VGSYGIKAGEGNAKRTKDMKASPQHVSPEEYIFAPLSA
jgi:hypothetical protein